MGSSPSPLSCCLSPRCRWPRLRCFSEPQEREATAEASQARSGTWPRRGDRRGLADGDPDRRSLTDAEGEWEVVSDPATALWRQELARTSSGSCESRDLARPQPTASRLPYLLPWLRVELHLPVANILRTDRGDDEAASSSGRPARLRAASIRVGTMMSRS